MAMKVSGTWRKYGNAPYFWKLNYGAEPGIQGAKAYSWVTEKEEKPIADDTLRVQAELIW